MGSSISLEDGGISGLGIGESPPHPDHDDDDDDDDTTIIRINILKKK